MNFACFRMFWSIYAFYIIEIKSKDEDHISPQHLLQILKHVPLIFSTLPVKTCNTDIGLELCALSSFHFSMLPSLMQLCIHQRNVREQINTLWIQWTVRMEYLFLFNGFLEYLSELKDEFCRLPVILQTSVVLLCFFWHFEILATGHTIFWYKMYYNMYKLSETLTEKIFYR